MTHTDRITCWSSLLLFAACSSGSVRIDGSTTDRGDDARRSDAVCAVTALPSERLTLPGKAALYVEPEAMVRGDEGVLLIGRPTYLYGFDADGEPVLEEAHRVLGVVIRYDGSVRAVPPPVEDSIAGLRAVTLPDGRWGVAFGLYEPRPDDLFGPATGFRFASFDGQSWSELEEPGPIPKPRGPTETSSLTTWNGEVWWAVRDSSYVPWILRRARTGWEREAFPVWTSYLELSGARGKPLHAAIVRPDTTRSYDRNSLFLYRREEVWREVRKISIDAVGRVHEPILDLQGTLPALAWWAIVAAVGGPVQVARAASDPLDPGAPVVDLDGSITHLRYAPVAGRRIWVLDHPRPAGSASELRVVQLESGRAEVIHALPSPFTGPFRAVTNGDGELLVAGPLLDREAGLLVTLLLRFRIDCDAAS